MIRRSILLVSVLALVAGACTSEGGEEPTASPTTSGPTSTSPPTPTPEPEPAAPFGEFTFVPLLAEDAPAYAGPATPHSLEGVRIAREVARVLRDPAIERTLTEQGFVVVPADLRLFHFAYQGNLYEGWPVYVTADAAYHVWHLVFDKLLRTVEQELVEHELESLVGGLLEAAEAQAAELAGTALEDTADRVEQVFEVAAAELGLPATLGPQAEQEKALIDAHTQTKESPIVGSTIDYTIYTPRGHYTWNEDLTRYFVTMSVLGQLAFCLPGTADCDDLEPTRRGIVASRVLTQDPELVDLWRRIYEPTAFLVGLADDYTPLEVAEAAGAVTDGGLSDLLAFADDTAVQDVAAALVASRPVRINANRASIRLMGVRFVADSYVLDQLIYDFVGTADEPRNLPSALDLAAAFGSEFAYDALDEMGETDYANYDTQLEKMRSYVAGRAPEEWGTTVYDAWLSALEPMFAERGEAFPDIMRTEAWAAKAHQAGLGSYAELKHDTILYAKQAIGEGGDGAPIADRRNWVEPEPVVFARLAAMAELMRSGLEQRELLTKELDLLLRDAIELFGFLRGIAEDELAGRPISEADNQRLTDIGHELESFFTRTSDQTKAGESEADLDAAIVADIASGGGNVLEVGTGRIDRIYVLVPDDEGTFQVAVGGVYSFYEFSTGGERLSDEEWRSRLDDGDAPERPAWEAVLFPR